jgi:hypothetical protein
MGKKINIVELIYNLCIKNVSESENLVAKERINLTI